MSSTDKRRSADQKRGVWDQQRRKIRRELGQNFLKDKRTAREIVRAAGVTDEDLVVEFGAGAGMLTRSLSERARRVVAVEYDPLWAASLGQSFAADERVEVVAADALSVPLPEEPSGLWRVCPSTSPPPSFTGSWMTRHSRPNSSTCWYRRR